MNSWLIVFIKSIFLLLLLSAILLEAKIEGENNIDPKSEEYNDIMQ